jgi:hypothetical protein
MGHENELVRRGGPGGGRARRQRTSRRDDLNPGNFITLARAVAPLIDPSAHGGLSTAGEPVFSCTANDGKSQLTITIDADAFPDEKQPSKTIRLQKLADVVRISKTIIDGK